MEITQNIPQRDKQVLNDRLLWNYFSFLFYFQSFPLLPEPLCINNILFSWFSTWINSCKFWKSYLTFCLGSHSDFINASPPVSVFLQAIVSSLKRIWLALNGPLVTSCGLKLSTLGGWLEITCYAIKWSIFYSC